MVQLIIPCYNEATRFNIHTFFDNFQFLENVHIIFVNDGSTDTTQELLLTIQLECETKNDTATVSILKLPNNVGKAEAVRQGMLLATKKPNTRFVAYFDADLATPLTEIKSLLNAMQSDSQRKMVLGSRIKKAGSTIERSALRHYTGRIFATVVNNLILKTAIYDTQCGAKMFTKQCAQQIFAEPFVSRWLFDIELISRMQVLYPTSHLNKIIYEQPLNTWKEMGDSKIRIKDLIEMPYQLYQIYNKQKDDFKKNKGTV
ncbi:MAG: glycosyl transferase family 2 [Aequorivita sp.]|nr:glycosyl transferase family 2 [Aequorivita sp.]|tara:strand:+ start:1002 stop:1778 length:777 start_codon:yes stop_codon:yes gene_type:complete